MPYRNACVVAELTSHGWVDARSFRSAMRSVLYKDMAVPSNRAAAAGAIDELVRRAQPAPFDLATRFPDAVMYVDVDHPYVSSRLETVAAALHHRPPVADGSSALGRFRGAVKELIRPDSSDGELLGFVQRQIGFGNYTRATFEDWFRLVWSDEQD